MKLKAVTINILLLLLAILLCLAVLEIGLRIFYPQSLSNVFWNPVYGKDFIADSHVVRYDTSNFLRGEYIYNININSDNLRDKEYAVERNEKPRYLFVGDSFTFGEGVDIPFPEILEKKYYNNSVEIINLGVYGMDIPYYYKRLKAKGLKYKPDKVFIVLFAGNDFLEEIDLGHVPEKTTIYNPLVLSCFRHLHLCPFVYSKLRKLRAPDIEKPECHSDAVRVKFNEVMRSFDQALDAFTKIADQESFELIFVIIPPIQDMDDSLFESRNVCGFERFQRSNTTRMRLINHGIQTIDLTEALLNKGDIWFKRDFHLNEKGHELAADEIYRFIESNISS